MRRRRLTAPAGTLLFLACGSDPAGPEPLPVTLATDATEYVTGDTIRLSLANHSPHIVGYNLCEPRLEMRLPLGGWLAVPRLPEGGACLALRYDLAPGDTARGTQAVYAAFEAGSYRFAGPVWIATSEVEVASNTFVVR